MKKNIIDETPLFAGLPENELQGIRQIAIKKNYRRGEVIFSEGDDGNGFYIVAEGRVKIYKVSPDGKEHILHIFGPGEPFGEVPVFTGKRFPANAEAIASSCLIFLPRPAFVNLISDNPSLALNMLAVLSKRLKQFTVQIEHLSLKEVPGRLAAYLILLSGEQQNDSVVQLSISKGQLASLLGTIPETLSRILGKMTEHNLITVSGRTINILDIHGLEALAEHGKI